MCCTTRAGRFIHSETHSPLLGFTVPLSSGQGAPHVQGQRLHQRRPEDLHRWEQQEDVPGEAKEGRGGEGRERGVWASFGEAPLLCGRLTAVNTHIIHYLTTQAVVCCAHGLLTASHISYTVGMKSLWVLPRTDRFHYLSRTIRIFSLYFLFKNILFIIIWVKKV